jgi:hypothetical protein
MFVVYAVKCILKNINLRLGLRSKVCYFILLAYLNNYLARFRLKTFLHRVLPRKENPNQEVRYSPLPFPSCPRLLLHNTI